ncbi:hypothetical protein ASA1KI_37570 [Opitutales bacterium ASA1]|uniref:hypothetical protein n=1 Tax=Congregicoccus parvus TaxID=3081749 RepID=UPI002B311A45|nr:hypothetical protein ASA1KI_37570 [Opitutales bacterium ASA1]
MKSALAPTPHDRCLEDVVSTPSPSYCPPIDARMKRKLTALVVASYAVLATVFCVGVFAPLG